MDHKTYKSKRLLAIMMTMMFIVLAACSNSGSNNVKENDKGNTEGSTEVSEASEGSNSFKLWLGWATTINKDSLVQKYWKENEPGIDVELESTQGDILTSLNLKMNTDGFEDAAVFNRNDTVKNAMIRSKKVLSLEQYFDMPDKYPSLAAIPKVYLDMMKDPDGHIWSIPTWFDQNPDDPWPGWASQTWLVRTDVLEAVGMSIEDLATIEGVEEYLQKASEQKDESGKALLPLKFLMDQNDSIGWNDENAVLSAFGVTTGGAGGVIPVEKKGDEFVLLFDDPQYKAAYQWLNKMYRAKLIDPEVVTDKKERNKEKNKAGRVAMNVGSFFNVDNSIWDTLDGPTEPGWFYKPIPFPKVAGVDEVGANAVVSPYPGNDVYISSNTKNLDAILRFIDYTLQPNPEHQQVINEGPAGLYWNWVDQPLGKWRFIDESYAKNRNSGEPVLKASVTPELYMLSSYNNEWYPWWNNEDIGAPSGSKKTPEYTKAIGQMGGVRGAHSHDTVPAKPGGLWEKYSPELETLRKEYRAKLMLSNNDEHFESNWKEFLQALENRGHWSELKAEWDESYKALIAENGEF